ncbi:hypothetical protein Q1695_009338 [Nippostrongylus brasiliensis]|nr:hypothetical protein Q1695_009338 [Nippostrongylus brasiliensis]
MKQTFNLTIIFLLFLKQTSHKPISTLSNSHKLLTGERCRDLEFECRIEELHRGLVVVDMVDLVCTTEDSRGVDTQEHFTSFSTE